MNQEAREAVRQNKPKGEWVLTKAFAEDVDPRTLVLLYEGPNSKVRQILKKTTNGFTLRSQETYRNGTLTGYKVII